MARLLRRVTALLLAIVVAAVIALVFTSRPRLDEAEGKVDARWTTLRAPLAVRYVRLALLNQAFHDSGEAGRDVSKQLSRELTGWATLQKTSRKKVDAEAEVTSANVLEGLANRLITIVQSSDRLRGVAALTLAVGAFQGAAPPRPAVQSYNDATRSYERTRDSFVRRPIADVFGYDARPVLELGI